MSASVVGRFITDGRKFASLRSCMLYGVAAFALMAFGADAIAQSSRAHSSRMQPRPADAVQPPPSLMIDPLDGQVTDFDVDPMTTGAIDPIARGNTGADVLQPSTIHYRLPESQELNGRRNELGMPMPDAPPLVVIGAPDVKTMIGARLLGDETVLRSYLPAGQREKILKAYEARGYQPFWVEDSGWSPAAQSVLAILSEARTHGLPPTRYLVPSIASGRIQALADADIRLSIAVATYARDAQGGLLDRDKIGTLVMPKLDLPSAEAVLATLDGKGDKAGEALSAYQPKTPEYEALRAKLIVLQKLKQDSQRPVADQPMAQASDGPAIKLAQSNDRTSLIRGQLGLNPTEDPATSRLYDSMLAEAAAAFQEQQDQSASSTAGAGPMVVALAGSSMNMLPARPADIARLETALRVNMERWRWLPHDLGERYVLVNVPEQNVKIIENGKVVQRVLGVVGRVDAPTPILSSTIGTVMLNPDWNLTEARIKSEIVPGIKYDNNYAVDRGYEIVREGRKITVREPVKVRYDLGQEKFMLTNDLSFYLHNTPDHTLFENKVRTLNKSTVRVDEPLKFAEILLNNKWTEEKLGKLIGGNERSLRLVKPVPIHVTYFTTAVDAGGKITTYPDVYGYDQELKKALDAF